MITLEELKVLSYARLEDAKTLHAAERYDGAFYICGYALELWLKKKICETLGWTGYPSSSKEFEHLKSFKTHDLEMLLHLSGIEGLVKSEFLTEWSIVKSWDPEIRYSTIKQEAKSMESMLKSAEILLNNL